ncbi:MAG TPA: hypothetical protein VFG42_09085 [Baekduia sp.]|uniref:hypothetical protein n=1 Tax=Baekduia sp. TaxID=2600305 RepID=UPI002D7848D0|nr:hypothetical protein [Baekduia sp.]HET6506930.1 hypothetical protein [Baekduia sp.]
MASLGAVLSLGLALLFGAQTAGAVQYCDPYAAGSYGTCYGPYAALSVNAVVAQTSSWTTCAGAQGSGGAFYGQYFCASDFSCHTYGGGSLTPLAHNHEGFGQTIYGFTNGSWAGSCPRGGPVSRAAGSASATDAVTGAPLRSYASGSKTCLSVPDGTVGEGITCVPKAVAAQRGVMGVLVDGADKTGAELTSNKRLFALAPVGATSATISGASGTKVRVPVKAGFVQVALQGGEEALNWDITPAVLALP